MSNLNKIEKVILTVMSMMKMNIEDYCDLETTDGKFNLVLNTGALVSIIHFEGTRTTISNQDFKEFVTRLTDTCSVFLNKPEHQLGMYFAKDLDSRNRLRKIADIKKNTARALGLEVDHLIDEETNVYAQYVYDETNYLVVITHPKALDSLEINIDARQKKEMIAEYQIENMTEAQAILLPNIYLRSQHETFVERLMSDFGQPEFAAQAELIDVTTALRAIRTKLYAELTHEEWEACTPANEQNIPIRWKDNSLDDDVSEFFYPTLASQLMIQGVVTCSSKDRSEQANMHMPPNTINTGERLYAPLMIANPPSRPLPFKELFDSLNQAAHKVDAGEARAMPFAISFMLTGDGLAGEFIKKLLVTFVARVNAGNANYRAAIQNLMQYKDVGGTVVKLQMAAMTWADNTPEGVMDLQVRRQKLWRIIETWGNARVTDKSGDPLLAWRSCIPGLSAKHHAPACPAPLPDALALLPFTRTASPFQHGTLLNRSVDGKLMPIELFSALQTTWVSVYTGKPGSGKSVALNNEIFESALLPGLRRLPLIFITDVGISSQGPVYMIQDALPKELKHLTVYERLQNTLNKTINPMDICVGRTAPLINEKSQMVNFLVTLVTPVEREGIAVEGMNNFVSAVIDMAFIMVQDNSEKGHPNIYQPGHNRELDDLLIDNGIRTDHRSYYSLVDECHRKQIYRARDLCQRYAMPTLANLVAAANSQDLQAQYKSTGIAGQSIIDIFIRGVSEAIAMYPVFSTTTSFDLDTARIVSLDLQDVIGANQKQTSLFFQIARMFMKRRFAYSVEDLPSFNDLYRPYYANLIEELMEDKKIMAMDELHNAKNEVNLFRELLRDAREARKWGIELKLASQLMTDFQDIIEFTTRFVIADRGSEKSRKWLQDNVSMRDVELEQLKYNVQLGKGGLTYMSRVKLKESDFTSLQTLTIGPQRLWALTTDADERLLRSNMYELTDNRPLSLHILGKYFPGGAKTYIQRLKEKERHGDERLNEEEVASLTRRVASDLYQRYLDDSITKETKPTAAA